MRFYRAYGKRLLDLSVVLILAPFVLPLLGLVAFLVLLMIGWPVIFRQERPGLGGRPFHVVKFRTMTDERGADGLLLSDFERRTAFGDLLRRTSIDELPQFWNVLLAEMALVGPRPLLTEYLQHYTVSQARRHNVRPGITGLAQVSGRNVTSWRSRLAFDAWYADHVSLGLDIQILARTFAALAKGGGSVDESWALGKYRGPLADPDRSGRLEGDRK